MEHWTSSLLVPPISDHAESPLWDHRSNQLLWVDQYLGVVRVAELDPDLSVTLLSPIPVPRPVGAIVLHEGGGWLLAAGDGIFELSKTGSIQSKISLLPNDGIRRRMNDAKVDPLGRLWAGSMAVDKTPHAGALYSLIVRKAAVALEGRTISNGLAWSPDGGTMYYVDTPTQRVDRFLVSEKGELVADGCVVAIPLEHGSPDGICIDDEGALWVALWGGSAVQRYSPAGELIGRVEVDAPQVSSCTFGGPGRGSLIITTSREGYGPSDISRNPLAGAIFLVRPGVSGPRADSFRG